MMWVLSFSILAFICSCPSICNFMHDVGFVLLNLGLHLVQLFLLLSHLSNGVLVFLLETYQDCFLLDVSFFKITPQFHNLCLSLLVEFNLSCCSSSGFTQTFTKVFKLPSQVRTL